MQASPLTAKKLFWIAYLALALIVAQAVKLHIHAYSHASSTDAEHTQQAHFAYQLSDVGTSSDELCQIDVPQHGVLKKIALAVLFIALPLVLLLFLPRGLCSPPDWRRTRRIAFADWLFSLRPPLRAPPR